MIAIRNSFDPEELYRELRELNPEAYVVKGFEEAYIGHTCGYDVIAVYDYDKCIDVLMCEHQCGYDEAETSLNEDTIAKCFMDNSPIFVKTK